jgi:fibronectin type 3 domain-containing protein
MNPKNAPHTRPNWNITLALFFLCLGCMAAIASAQDTLRPIKAGDPAFTESKLTPEVRHWYQRFWKAALNSNPGHELDPASNAKSGDNYRMGRPFEKHITALLMVYRLTGDLKVLDEVDRLMQMARAQLRDAWDNGKTDGFLNWRDYRNTPADQVGTDLARPIDEILMSGMLAEVAWTYRVNQAVPSPKGISYKERADFWQNYLSNHWEKKMRKREGKNATQFPFADKPIHHVYVGFLRYHYYMSKLTGRTDYMNEAMRMASVVAKNSCLVSGPNGDVYVMPHMVYYDPTSNSSLSATTQPYAHMTTYVRSTFSSYISMAMEGFAQFAEPGVMRKYVGAFRDFMLDGESPMVDRSICGDLSRTGIMNGVKRTVKPASLSSQYGRANEGNYASSAQMLAAIWDPTGKMHSVNEHTYGVTQSWTIESPTTIFSSVAMMWYGHTKGLSTRPYAPNNFIPKSVAHNQVDLVWTDNSSNEAGFRIERSLDGVKFVLAATIPANTTKYSDTGLKMSTKYHYRIFAYNAYGTSPYWGKPKDITTKKAPPAAPSNLTARSTSTSSIQLEWSDNSDNETSFKIEKRKDGQLWSGLATVGANVKTYTHSGVTKGVKFYYRVRASNGAGDSARSPEASAIVGQTPPSAPSNLSATVLSNTQIKLSWNDNSSIEDDFRVLRSIDNVLFTEIAKLPANTTTYTASGLQSGAKYYFKVRAHDVGGDSGYTPTVSATTSTGTTLSKPTAPSSLSATAVSSSRIDLKWTDNSSVEDGFLIQRSVDGSSFSTVGTVGANVSNYSNTGLTSSTKYYYQIVAQNTAGTATSSVASASTLTASKPAAPTNLVALAVSTGQINLSWTDNSSVENEYRIERSSDGVSFTQIAIVGANVVQYSDSGLNASQKYFHRVRAHNLNGYSSYSNTSSATTLSPVIAPTAPVLQATQSSDTSVLLNWSASMDADGIAHYRLYRNGVELSVSSDLEHLDQNLTNGSSYTYMVKAVDKTGLSSTESNSVTVTLKPILVDSKTRILMVVGSTALNTGDEAIRQHLVQKGYDVTLVAAKVVQSTSVVDQDLILISSTCASSEIGTRLRDIPIPVICWEPYLFDDMGMTGLVTGTDYHWLPDQSRIHVNGTSSSIASTVGGWQIVHTSSQAMGWGQPGAGAHVVATITGTSTTPCIFTYKAGANMVGMKAPASRVGFFLGDTGAASLTPAGWKIFDQTVQWVLSEG